MFGVGPEWLHTTSGGKNRRFNFGGEAVLLCFGRDQGESSGWYLEPSYGYDFGSGH
jgi:hypothetical protein